MIDFCQRAGRYLCWAIATLIAVLTLSAAVLSGGDDAALRSHQGTPSASPSRPLVRVPPAPTLPGP
jgi:hypothetical protein